MSLVDSSSQFNAQKISSASDIVEVRDACVGDENKVDEEDFKRTILLDQWRRRLRAKDFVDQLLEKEERIREEELGCVYFQPQMRMHFGARVENGLMTEDQFCYHHRGIGSGNFPGPNNLSASTPALSTSNNNSSLFSGPSNWNLNYNHNTNWVNYFPQT
ncbi:hypothetical protein ACTXT7_009618 [Hymenolepis weldensis]